MFMNSGRVNGVGSTKDEEVHITLMTEEFECKDKIDKLLRETICCMILDLGCLKTVCGKKWLELYLDALDKIQLHKVKYESTNSAFRFGDSVKH